MSGAGPAGAPAPAAPGGAEGPEVAFAGVWRQYGGEGGHVALRALDLEVKRGELLVLIGPSGCGKSTTLRLLAGLDRPDRGEVFLAGRPTAGVPPQERDVAMVFQGYALYPHMSVRENLAFPLKMRRVPAGERARRVAETADTLGLGRLLDRLPDELSGGERQRVAMGRALVRRPRVYLFDEPLSNLDAALRVELRREIGALVHRLGVTALYVTHDHAEAMTLGDRVAVLRAGELQQVATPRAIYEAPANDFVAGFVGSPRINLARGQNEAGEVRVGPFRLRPPAGLGPGDALVGVRPESVRLGEGGAEGGPGPAASPGVEGEVSSVEPLGAETHLVLEVGGLTLRARVPGFSPLGRGDRVRVSLDEAALHFFDPSRGGRRVAGAA
ncbi:MAG TPA: ABC transporter ATP-binding protein [Polyangiaceae bacterium]|nr:ABC transporter ATP-binding protein [Polyangiaceae bacterium]